MLKRRPTAVIDEQWMVEAHDAYRESVDSTTEQTKTKANWFQEVGFWSPTLTIDSAVSKYRHCVNGTHNERFRTHELMAQSVVFGGHQLLQFWARSAGYDLVPIPDAQFDAQLVAGFADRLSAIERSTAQLASTAKLIAARNAYDEQQARRASNPARVMFAKLAEEGPL